MGFYAPAQLVRDAKEHGVHVLPVDINHSRWDCTLEDGAIRLGFRMIVRIRQAEAIVLEQTRPFRTMESVRRCGVSPSTVNRLAPVRMPSPRLC
jgi:error-prone DNA polymerase